MEKDDFIMMDVANTYSVMKMTRNGRNGNHLVACKWSGGHMMITVFNSCFKIFRKLFLRDLLRNNKICMSLYEAWPKTWIWAQLMICFMSEKDRTIGDGVVDADTELPTSTIASEHDKSEQLGAFEKWRNIT